MLGRRRQYAVGVVTSFQQCLSKHMHMIFCPCEHARVPSLGPTLQMHPDEYQMVNAFCRFPAWENVHFAGGEELPVWVKDPMQRAEFLTVAVASTAGEHQHQHSSWNCRNCWMNLQTSSALTEKAWA